MYTGSVPTYREIKETEALSVVNRWFNTLYGDAIPPEINNVVFEMRFLDYLTQHNFCTNAAFRDLQPIGEPFKNVYASVELNHPKILEKQYGPDLVVLQEAIQDNYTSIHFVTNGYGSSKVFLKDATIKFLKVICGDSPYNITILRLLIRNIITSPFEGRNWQSAVFLYGAPGTSKSVWADLVKRLVPSHHVQEFNRHQNKNTFSVGQLADCRLLIVIVSDLTQITNKQVEVLKRVLGRDTLTHETKYLSEFGIISPSCQILIISNKGPNEFPLFGNDQAIMDKLIKVYLGPVLQIPSKLQLPNIATSLDRYISDIFN